MFEICSQSIDINIIIEHFICVKLILYVCFFFQIVWRGNVSSESQQKQGSVLWSANRKAAGRWRSAFCHPIAALRSSGEGQSIRAACLGPLVQRRSAPLNSQVCTAPASRHHHMTDTTMSHLMLPLMMIRSTARRRTSSRKRRNEVRFFFLISVFAVFLVGWYLKEFKRINHLHS